MTKLTREQKKMIVSHPDFVENVYDVYEELYKLVEYYKNELKQNNLQIQRETKARNAEGVANLQGLNEAYGDNIAEVAYILEMIKGKHKGTKVG